MVVDKVINNNLVRALNHNNVEVLVMGCGLGFKKKPGDPIRDELIEKIYKITDTKVENQLEELLPSIPQENIRISNAIIEYAKEEMGMKLKDSIYFSLTDHINYAIERAQNGILLKNDILWVIKKYYTREFKVGQKAVSLIEELLGLTLTDDEAGFVALHVITAEKEANTSVQTTDEVKLVQNAIQIVKYHFHRELDENSIHYERFLTHLKFYAQRVLDDKEIEPDDESFVRIIQEKYANEYKCACKIGNYVKKEFHRESTEEELVYLAVHIKRITM
jgi:beta-glucoside operon transcriptional antiterminator